MQDYCGLQLLDYIMKIVESVMERIIWSTHKIDENQYGFMLAEDPWILQASAYEKQGRGTIACLATKIRGYRQAKSCTPPTM